MRINVHVIPGSSKSDVESGDPWRAHVHARPAEGKANEELLQILSDYFGVPRSAVHILSGHTSRSKTVDIGLEGSAMTKGTR